MPRAGCPGFYMHDLISRSRPGQRNSIINTLSPHITDVKTRRFWETKALPHNHRVNAFSTQERLTPKLGLLPQPCDTCPRYPELPTQAAPACPPSPSALPLWPGVRWRVSFRLSVSATPGRRLGLSSSHSPHTAPGKPVAARRASPSSSLCPPRFALPGFLP